MHEVNEDEVKDDRGGLKPNDETVSRRDAELSHEVSEMVMIDGMKVRGCLGGRLQMP